MRRSPLVWSLLVILITGLATSCNKEEKKLSNREIYLYQGPDRDQKLIANAKKEGAVTIYTSMSLKDSEPITDFFQQKYNIKVTLWRALPDKVAQRALIEAKADRYDVDVLEISGPEMEMLYREKLLEEFYSPAFKDIPPEAIPAHKHYIVDRLNFLVLAYNTKLVKPNEVPKSYEDLLNRKWFGKLGIESTDSDWFAAIVKNMGEEKGLNYFKKLAAMRPRMQKGQTQIAEIVGSGELPVALNVYNHNVEKLKKQEVAIEWKALQPTFGQAGAIGIARNAAHPHAALLFADFILSREGQEILKERGRVPVSLAVDTPLNKFQYQVIDPAIVLDESDKWGKLWSELFLGGKMVQKGE